MLLDTPGIHKPHHLLGEHLVKVARSTIGEVDLVVLLMDGSTSPGHGDAYIIQLLRHCAARLVVDRPVTQAMDPGLAFAQLCQQVAAIPAA